MSKVAARAMSCGRHRKKRFAMAATSSNRTVCTRRAIEVDSWVPAKAASSMTLASPVTSDTTTPRANEWAGKAPAGPTPPRRELTSATEQERL